MSNWQPIKGDDSPVSVAIGLDPTDRRLLSFGFDLRLYLRLNVLLWGRLLIPESFLLHNPVLAQSVSEAGALLGDFSAFLDQARPLISRNGRDYNDSFESFWHASVQTKDPLLIGGEPGLNLARFLDGAVHKEDSKAYESVASLRTFESLFASELEKIDPTSALLERVRAAIQSVDLASADENVRLDIDGFVGVTRGGVEAALRARSNESPIASSECQLVRAAAQQAYAKNVLASLSPRKEHNAQVPLCSEVQLKGEEGYGLRLDAQVGDRILALLVGGESRRYSIDATTLRRTPWDRIAELGEHPSRLAFAHHRAEAIKCELRGDADGYSERLNKMVHYLDLFLSDVGDALRGRSSLVLAARPYELTPRRIGGSAASMLLSVLLQGPIWPVWFGVETLGIRVANALTENEADGRRAALRDCLVQPLGEPRLGDGGSP